MSVSPASSTTPSPEPLTAMADVVPWEFLERLRAAGEVVWDTSANAWLVTSYDAIKELIRGDGSVFRRPWEVPGKGGPAGMSEQEWGDILTLGSRRHIFQLYGAAHDSQHRWWMSAFSPDVLERWRAQVMRPFADAAIDRFIENGRAELVADYALRVPPRVIAGLLGVPHDDQWITRMQAATSTRSEMRQHRGGLPPDQDLIERVGAATREMRELLAPFVEERRSGEGDDLISMFWRDAALIFGEDYETVDIMAAASVTWEAGTGTTALSTTNASYLLLEHPEIQERLRHGDAKLLTRYVEESLRLLGPVSFRTERIAVQDTTIAGVAIKQGDMVIGVIAAAGRDPRRYNCPAELDLERPFPRDHFSFWSGPMICAGQGLGRAQVETNVAALLDRLGDLRPDPDAEPPRYAGYLLRSWRPLHVLFEPA